MENIEKQVKSLISSISNLIVIQIVAFSVLVGGGWYLYIDLKKEISSISTSSDLQAEVPIYIDEWEKFERDHNATLGPDDAKIVIVEYTDFQCPFCQRHQEGTRKNLLKKYEGKIQLVYKHFPLQEIHPMAMLSAIAAQCAKREGKFWEVEEVFFKNSKKLDKELIVTIGKSVGLGDAYANCIENKTTRAEVEKDIEDGVESGVSGTPTFLVNGKILKGALPLEAFDTAIAEINDI